MWRCYKETVGGFGFGLLNDFARVYILRFVSYIQSATNCQCIVNQEFFEIRNISNILYPLSKQLEDISLHWEEELSKGNILFSAADTTSSCLGTPSWDPEHQGIEG